MAKLLCINEITKRPFNNLTDVVGVFPDDWPFTANEHAQFKIIDVPGTKAEVEAKLPHIEIKEVFVNAAGQYVERVDEPKLTVEKPMGCYGVVLSKDAQNIEVQEKEFRIAFVITKDTEYALDDTIDTIAVGDKIGVTYKPQDGKNVAYLIRADRERKELWNDNGTWREVVKRTKYRASAYNLNEEELADLSSADKVKSDAAVSRMAATITLEPSNLGLSKTFKTAETVLADKVALKAVQVEE